MLLTGSRVVLRRHGVTDSTASGRWDRRGGADSALNAEGYVQTRDLAVRIGTLTGDASEVRAVLSSLRRAKEIVTPTAELFRAGVIPRRARDELVFGEWDGLIGDELRGEKPDELLRLWGDETFRVPGGESHVDLHIRVRPVFEKFMGFSGTTVVVIHWGPIMSCIPLVLGIDLPSAWRFNLAPASMTPSMVVKQGPQVESIDDLRVRATPPESI